MLKLLYIAEDRAVIYNGRDKCIYFPIGRIPSPRELLEIHRAFSENKLLLPDSRIYNVPPGYPEKFPEARALFDFDANPGEADYIYDVEKQIALTGPKLRKKRNHIKHFTAQNPNASVEPMGESNFKSVLRFMDSEDDKKHLFAEEVAIAEAFENFRTRHIKHDQFAPFLTIRLRRGPRPASRCYSHRACARMVPKNSQVGATGHERQAE